MITLVSMHSAQYRELASITGANKQQYCYRHGYSWYDEEVPTIPNFSFQKFMLVQKMFGASFNNDWIWFTGADALITNFTINLEDITNTEASFIIATDRNGYNADSFFIRNNFIGNGFVQWLAQQEGILPDEQAAITAGVVLEQFKEHVLVLPQRTINSYNYNLYPNPQDSTDKLGTNGQWQEGDLLIHWPGFSHNPEYRVRWANEILSRVKYD